MPFQSKRALVAGAVVLVVLLGGAVWWSARDDGSESSPGEATATASPTRSGPSEPTTTNTTGPPESSPSPSAGAGTASPEGSPPSRPPVDLDELADFGDGVRASLQSVRRVSVEGQGPGEVSGPGVQIAIRIVNGREEPLDLSAVVVNAAWGGDETPASQVDSSSRPFEGRAAAGARARGVYVFSLPENGLDDLTVTVSHSALSPVVVFSGDVE